MITGALPANLNFKGGLEGITGKDGYYYINKIFPVNACFLIGLRFAVIHKCNF